jgi:hypothetical protein
VEKARAVRVRREKAVRRAAVVTMMMRVIAAVTLITQAGARGEGEGARA